MLLSAAERIGPLRRGRLLAEVIAAYVRVRRDLRQLPIEKAVAELRCEPADRVESPRGGANPVDEARRLGWIVVRTLAYLPGDTRCLRRSLVLTRLLARRGIPGRLIIAARPEPDFLAHAWVECEGQPVLAPADGSFGRLAEL